MILTLVRVYLLTKVDCFVAVVDDAADVVVAEFAAVGAAVVVVLFVVAYVADEFADSDVPRLARRWQLPIGNDAARVLYE